MKKGIFVTIEGPDGSGKSTQLSFIKKYFEKVQIAPLFTREPGGTSISEKIREIILDKDNKEMDSKTEALLYAASRAQHVSQVIRPALESGRIVVCDRYIDSSIVYQGIGRNLGHKIEEISNWATDGLMPDLTILIVVDPDTGKTRRTNREEDRIELENKSFHQTVFEGYISLKDRFPERILLIDGTKCIEEISSQIAQSLENLLNK